MDRDNAAARDWVSAFKTLETPRILARRLRIDDDQILFDTLSDPRVNAWIGGFEQPFTLSSARRWLTPRLDRMDNGDGVYGAVFHRVSRVLLGFMYAVRDPAHDGIEIAGALNELYWGKGLVEELSFALINDLFAAGVPRVIATCATDNFSSMRVLRTLNFERMGAKDIVTPNGPRPSWVYALTPERWQAAIIVTALETPSGDDVKRRRAALQALCRELKQERRDRVR